MNEETLCSHCGESFDTKGKYKYHYRKVHQNGNKQHQSDQLEAGIHRDEDEKFHCLCGKEYVLYDSLCRHHKNCRQWKDHQTSRELTIESNDSEQSRSINTLTNIKTTTLPPRNSLFKDHLLCHWQGMRDTTLQSVQTVILDFLLTGSSTI
jgi:hypothetical protein